MPGPRISALKLVATGLYLLFWPVLLLALSGDWGWAEGWIFCIWLLALCSTTIAWLYRKDPALLAERYRRPGTGGQPRGDALIVIGLVVGFVAFIAVPPLDARRFRWSPPLPVWLEGVGLAMLLASAFLLFRSFTDNPFLSPLVRVQSERRQEVVSTGVYGFVRHPMYLGAGLMFLGGPLLMSSIFGMAVGAALVALLGFRIGGEERLLAQQLAGYDEYRQRVRYRLVPHLW